MSALPFALVVHVPLVAVPLVVLVLLARRWPAALAPEQRQWGLPESLLAISGVMLWTGAILVAALWIGDVCRAAYGFDVVRIVSFVPRRPGGAILAASFSAVLGAVMPALMLASPRFRRAASSAAWYRRAVLIPVKVLLAATMALMLLWGFLTALD